MGKPHPIELRSRVVAFVEEGNSHREAARHLRVSLRFVNNLVIRQRTVGSLVPPRQGYAPGGGKLDELCVELAERGVAAHHSTVCCSSLD
jgi:transposase